MGGICTGLLAVTVCRNAFLESTLAKVHFRTVQTERVNRTLVGAHDAQSARR